LGPRPKLFAKGKEGAGNEGRARLHRKKMSALKKPAWNKRLGGGWDGAKQNTAFAVKLFSAPSARGGIWKNGGKRKNAWEGGGGGGLKTKGISTEKSVGAHFSKKHQRKKAGSEKRAKKKNLWDQEKKIF